MPRKKTGQEIIEGVKRDLERLYNIRFTDDRRYEQGPLMVEDNENLPVRLTADCAQAVHALEKYLGDAEKVMRRTEERDGPCIPERPQKRRSHSIQAAAEPTV